MIILYDILLIVDVISVKHFYCLIIKDEGLITYAHFFPLWINLFIITFCDNYQKFICSFVSGYRY